MTPIRTALLSYGMSGKVFHAPLLINNPGFIISTVVRHGKPVEPPAGAMIVDQVSKVWQDRSIELVVVNTPNHTHFDLAKGALENDKHVVVEKPFTVNAVEADTLIELAAKRKRVLTVFQSRRWDSDFLTVQDVLKSGRLGRLVEFESHYDRYRPEIERNTWKEIAAPGTSILYNLGSHLIDQVLVLFGLPQEVDARIGIQRGGAVEDYYDIRMTYDGLNVILKSSYLVCQPGPRFMMHGTEGSFVKFGLDPQEEQLKSGKKPGDDQWGREPEAIYGALTTRHAKEVVASVPGNYPAFYQNVHEAIRNGKPPAVKAEEARDVIRIIEACYQSGRARRAISIKP